MIATDGTVTDPTDSGADVYAWDWSATTHQTDPEDKPEMIWADLERGKGRMLRTIIESLDAETHLPGKGLQGWASSVQAFDRRGDKVANVYYGGQREDVHVVTTSDVSNLVRPRVTALFGAKTARVDTRVDTLVPFEQLEEICRDVAGSRTKVTYMESRIGDQSTGRTLYVGAPSSDVRVRFYEKWLESPGLYEDGTNRVEVQLRPPSRGKADVSRWGPGETFCASALTQRLAVALGTDLHAPGSLKKAKDTPDLERTLRAMGTQYGGAVERWLSLSGGDIGAVLDHLSGDHRIEPVPPF